MQAKRAVVSVDLPLRTKRGSNFGRVDALRWWLKLRHEGAPPCPGDCFLSQKSKRKPHERDMGDNLEVAVSRVCHWANEEMNRLPEGGVLRARLATILRELPTYGSPEWEDFNETNLIPLLRGLKEGTIGRKHRESEGVMQTDLRRAKRTRETLEGTALKLLQEIIALHKDAWRMSLDDPAKASRVIKLLSKQLNELHKLSGSAELPVDYLTPPLVKVASMTGSALMGSALLTNTAKQADRAAVQDGGSGSSEGADVEDETRWPDAKSAEHQDSNATIGDAPPRVDQVPPAHVESGETLQQSPPRRAENGAPEERSSMWAEDVADEEPSASQASLVGHLQAMSSQECGELGLLQSQDSSVLDTTFMELQGDPKSCVPDLRPFSSPSQPLTQKEALQPQPDTDGACPTALQTANAHSAAPHMTVGSNCAVTERNAHPAWLEPPPSLVHTSVVNLAKSAWEIAPEKMQHEDNGNDIMDAARGLRALRALIHNPDSGDECEGGGFA